MTRRKRWQGLKTFQENCFLVRTETIHVGGTERGLGDVNSTSSIPSVGQGIRLLREGQVKVYLNGELNSLAIKPRLEGSISRKSGSILMHLHSSQWSPRP